MHRGPKGREIEQKSLGKWAELDNVWFIDLWAVCVAQSSRECPEIIVWNHFLFRIVALE